MPSSLRATVIAWYGLLVVVVFIVLGALLQLRLREALFAQLDATIESHGRAIASALDLDIFAGWELDLSEEYLQVVASENWFEITRPDGSVLRSGGQVPALEGPLLEGLHDRGADREFIVAGPRGTHVRIGRHALAERAQLRELLHTTVGLGAGLLLVAVVVGWWLMTRTLRPIEHISRAAESISASDLERRIPVDSVPMELRDLAVTLNTAFDRLAAAFDSQARFTADASHELRTPLSVIRSQVELALRRERSPEEYRAALEASLRAVQRMTRMVDQLLSLARADGVPAARCMEEVELDLVVREVVREAQEDAQRAKVAVGCAAEPTRVLGDATQLAELASNLVANAIRYNRPGGRVDVLLERSDGVVRLCVTDTGSGIPEHALPFLFERFYQVDPARSRASGGSGLGLALARRIALAHGGDIRVESRQGVGSSFSVTLPASSSSVQV